MLNDTSNIIQGELSPGEQLLWSGRPCQGTLFRKSDIGSVPFGLLWCGMVIFGGVNSFIAKEPISAYAWLVLFLPIGLYLVAGRFMIDTRQRAHTYYAVTNERVLIICCWPSKKVTSINLRTLDEMSLIRGPGRLETISFGLYNTSPTASQQTVPCFEMRGDSQMVHDLIFSAQKQSKETLIADAPILQRLQEGNRHSALGGHYEMLRSHLVAGEKLLWAGQPRQGLVLRTADWFMVPFSFAWGGTALYAGVGAIRGGAPLASYVVVIPFLLLGLQMMVGRFLYNARQRAGIYLGVTTERVLFVSTWPFQKVHTVNLLSLSETIYQENKGRFGTVTFGKSGHRRGHGGNPILTGADTQPGTCFEGIADAKAVHDLIRHARKVAIVSPP